MAEGLDPDEKGRQKNESILLWLKNVEMATQHGPNVPDRGLTSNPDLTSLAHDPTCRVTPAADPTLASSPPPPHRPTPSSMYHRPELLPAQLQRNRALATRSASLSLSSNLPPVILSRLPPSRSSLRHTRGPPPWKKTNTQGLSLASAQSQSVASSQAGQHFAPKETIKCEEKSSEERIMAKVSEEKETVELFEEKEEAVLAKDDVMSGDDQRLRELRSLMRTRQSSLSPLPAPTAQPLLPTFNLSNIRAALPPNRPWLKKKLPTVTGARPRGRVPILPPHMKLVRATTSPSELTTAVQPQSAPSSPEHKRAMPHSSEGNKGTSSSQDNLKDEEKLIRRRLATLVRRKSFSHDDVSQLQQFEQLNVGGVSPADESYGSINENEGAPGSQQSLVAEGGSSEGEGEKSGHSVGKAEGVPSDEAAMRGNSGGLPSSQSVSSVISDREDSDSVNQASHHRPQPSSQLPVHQDDQRKVVSSSMCPLSPPSLSSPRTPHSPLMRQRHIIRSPSPSYPQTPPTSPLHQSRMSGSHAGTESGNVISKQRLKLLSEGQTFSFDTSEDSDFTKLTRQPKFLKKSLQTCPISPPPSLLSPPSPQCSPSTTQYVAHHHHHQQHSLSESAATRMCRSPSPTQLGGPSLRSRSPVLSEQLLLRRGSTPVSLSSMQTQQGGGPFSAKSSRIQSNRSSFHSTLSPQAKRKSTVPKSVREESKVSSCKRRDSGMAQINTSGHQIGHDKGPVNRQDSGLGTLSTISNKFNL